MDMNRPMKGKDTSPAKQALAGSVAETLARGLVRHNVQQIFGQSLPSALILAATAVGIRQISYRTENAGGAMADGFARVSHRVGVVAAQNGPAATLLVAPLSEALAASIPIVALVQDVPVSTRDRNGFQELNHFELFASCAKWVRRLDDPNRADDYLDMAFVAASSGRAGPAVLLLPKDVLREASTAARKPRSSGLGKYPLDRLRPAAGSIEKAAQLLAAAKSPVIVAGGGVPASDAAGALAAIQEKFRIPVATTIMGKGSVLDTHPLSLGVLGYASGAKDSPSEFLAPILSAADVVCLVGTRTNENATDSWRLYPPDATYIHIDIDGSEVGRNYEAVRVVGDAHAALEDLFSSLGGIDTSQRTSNSAALEKAIATARERAKPNVVHRTLSTDIPIRPERIMHEIALRLRDDAIVVSDASYSSVWMANYLPATSTAQRFIAPRGLAGLGWGLPLAVGAKAAEPERPVLCIAGDGAFAHTWAEMETCIRSDLPVTIVLLNNGVLGYQKHAELFQFGDYTSAIDFAPVDHAAIARACGARGVRITDPDQLGQALDEAMASETTTLIEVMTTPSAYPLIRAWDGHEEILLSRD